MSREAFGRELIRAAYSHLGKSALLHWKFAGNCLNPAVEGLCFDNGLGPDAFDCSGLIAHAVSEVRGQRVEDWPNNLRHVRDMWAANGVAADNAEAVLPGDILVQALFNQDGQIVRPFHVGVVVDVKSQETLWLHASSGDGEVIISPVPEAPRILGRYAVEA